VGGRAGWGSIFYFGFTLCGSDPKLIRWGGSGRCQCAVQPGDLLPQGPGVPPLHRNIHILYMTPGYSVDAVSYHRGRAWSTTELRRSGGTSKPRCVATRRPNVTSMRSNRRMLRAAVPRPHLRRTAAPRPTARSPKYECATPV
jgi:hypothetical protein